MSDPQQPVTGKRKRKWDVAADGAVAPAPSAQPAGAAPVPLPPKVLSGGADAPRLPVRMPTEEEPEPPRDTGKLVHKIDINSSPARFYITKADFQKKITADTGVAVSTRGMYLQEGGILPIGEEPLYLQLDADDQESLDKAKAAIQEAMDSIKEPQVFEIRLFANFPPASEMRAKGKVLGPRGQFVKYIEQKYGVRVQLKGDRVWGEENEEHLHLHLAAPNAEQMAAGKKACANLLDHVRNEFIRIYGKETPVPGHGPPGAPPPGHGPPGHGPPGHGPPGHGPPGYGPPGQAPPGHGGQAPSGYGPTGVPPQGQYGPPGGAPPPPGGAPPPPGHGQAYGQPPMLGYAQQPPLPQEPPPPPPGAPPPDQPPPPPPGEQPPPPPGGPPPAKKMRTEAEDPLLGPFNAPAPVSSTSAPAYNPQSSLTATLKRAFERPASHASASADAFSSLRVPDELKSTSTAPFEETGNRAGAQPFWSVASSGQESSVFGGLPAAEAKPRSDRTSSSAAKAKEAKFDDFMSAIGVEPRK